MTDCILKPHAYLQTMTKTPVKFQKNQYKTVGGVAPTRYPLSIHIFKYPTIKETHHVELFNPQENHK